MTKDEETIKRQHELDTWNSLYGSTAKCKKLLAATRSDFRKYFPEGHKTQIDDLFYKIAEKVKAKETLDVPFESLDTVHPRAWSIILAHGKHYVPQSFHEHRPWEWDRQPLREHVFGMPSSYSGK